MCKERMLVHVRTRSDHAIVLEPANSTHGTSSCHLGCGVGRRSVIGPGWRRACEHAMMPRTKLDRAFWWEVVCRNPGRITVLLLIFQSEVRKQLLAPESDAVPSKKTETAATVPGPASRGISTVCEPFCATLPSRWLSASCYVGSQQYFACWSTSSKRTSRRATLHVPHWKGSVTPMATAAHGRSRHAKGWMGSWRSSAVTLATRRRGCGSLCPPASRG